MNLTFKRNPINALDRYFHMFYCRVIRQQIKEREREETYIDGQTDNKRHQLCVNISSFHILFILHLYWKLFILYCKYTRHEEGMQHFIIYLIKLNAKRTLTYTFQMSVWWSIPLMIVIILFIELQINHNVNFPSFLKCILCF